MTTKRYDIFLDDKIIGATELDKADATMGVVFGNMELCNISSGYEFFKSYSMTNGLEINSDYLEDKLITIYDIPTLKIINSDGVEIMGEGTGISGMDSDVFEITILGIPYPFYEKEFPHHVRGYEDQFKNN